MLDIYILAISYLTSKSFIKFSLHLLVLEPYSSTITVILTNSYIR
jgi:hypothetical protein